MRFTAVLALGTLIFAGLIPSIEAQSGNPAPSSTEAAARTAADSKIASLMETLGQVRTPTSVAISPDGRSIAWALNGAQGSELHLTSLAPAGAVQGPERDRILSPDPGTAIAGTQCAASGPVWSPDGTQLAFLSECTSGDSQALPQKNIVVWAAATNVMKQISHLHGEVSSLAWSPDGKSIGFLYVENATRRAGALDAMKPWSGVIGEDGVEVQRVYAVNVEHAAGNWLTPADVHAYEFTWSPDSKHLCFAGAPPPGENTWWVAKLYAEEIIDRIVFAGASKTEIYDYGTDHLQTVLDPKTTPGPLHGLQIALPRFSPDGKQIAFIGGLMSDQGATGGDIYIVPADGLKPGEQPKDVTPDIDGTPTWLHWESDHTIGFVEDRRGHTLLNAVNINDLKITPGAPVDLGEVSIGGGPIKDAIGVAIPPADHKNPTLAFVESGFAVAPEVFAGPAGHLQQITHLNDALKPAWGKAESIDYTNEGLHIQGWLLYPAGWSPNKYDPAKKYPLIVSAHGGPSSAVIPRWPGVGTVQFPSPR
jgi:dipeptidyl aminopeptidase/acylaminoacyl peptidase